MIECKTFLEILAGSLLGICVFAMWASLLAALTLKDVSNLKWNIFGWIVPIIIIIIIIAAILYFKAQWTIMVIFPIVIIPIGLLGYLFKLPSKIFSFVAACIGFLIGIIVVKTHHHFRRSK